MFVDVMELYQLFLLSQGGTITAFDLIDIFRNT